jgi:hypothetical protein
MGRQPASLINAMATQIINEQYTWNVARFGPMPTGGGGGGSKMVPKGPNGEAGTYWVWYLSYPFYDDPDYPTQPQPIPDTVYGRGSYDGPPPYLCGDQTAEWSDDEYPQAVWRVSVQNLTVFGDSSCDYTVSDDSYNLPGGSLIGTITCDKWQDAKCYAEDLSLMELMDCPQGHLWFFRSAYCNWG